MGIVFDPERYTHESDRAALKALKAVPGFSALMKAFMNIWNERQQKILNMSSRIRLGEKQMRKYYDMLPPICEKLGIAVPELYLEMNVMPNAYTSGDTNPFIVITSGLLKTLPDELVPTILAHECGHIACRHVLFLTMGRIVLQGAGGLLSSSLPIGSLLTVPLQMAFYYWMRCSEFSADRAAVLCDGNPGPMQEVCMRMAGWDKEIDADVDMQAFLDQAADYRELVGGNKWNKALEFMILSRATHPLMAVRATECGEWAKSIEYARILKGETPVSVCAAQPAEEKRDEKDESVPGDEISSRIVKLFTEPDRILVPEGYEPLPPKEDDLPDSSVYGRVTTQSDSFVQVYPVAEGEELPEDPAALVDAVRAAMTEDQGILEAGTGTTRNGNPYVLCLVKTVRPKKGTEYCLTMQIRRDGKLYAVRGFFTETASPGFREAAVRGTLFRKLQAQGGSGTALAWNYDPYDSSNTAGALMNRSEEKEYDARFPLHPLTEARKFAAEILRMN